MTKKHFKAVAEIIENTPMASDTRTELVDKLCCYFISENSLFNSEKFRKACYGDREV